MAKSLLRLLSFVSKNTVQRLPPIILLIAVNGGPSYDLYNGRCSASSVLAVEITLPQQLLSNHTTELRDVWSDITSRITDTAERPSLPS